MLIHMLCQYLTGALASPKHVGAELWPDEDVPQLELIDLSSNSGLGGLLPNWPTNNALQSLKELHISNCSFQGAAIQCF